MKHVFCYNIEISQINWLLAIDLLMIIFVNNLDPDQVRQSDGFDLDPLWT